MAVISSHHHAPGLNRRPFSVAPMLDCTDRHFRVLMRQISTCALLPPASQTPVERLATDIARLACVTNDGLCT